MSQPSPDGILQLGFAFWASRTFLTAVEMGLFTELAKRGPMTLAQLEQQFKLHPRSSRDFADALVALGMLGRDGDKYANTPDSALFLDRNKPAYIGGILEMCSERLYPFWDALPEALRDGKPKNEAARGGKHFFEELYADPDRLKLFLQSMTGLSMGSAIGIAQKFPFGKYKTCIDIGCAQGCVSVQVALAHKHITGGGFDLPVVQPIFDEYIQSFELQSRLKFHAGNFMSDPLPKADVLVMGHILHDWDLAEKQMLIKKAYDALPSGGALVLHEALIDDDRRKNAFGLLMSLNMLIETPGGFDYTGADAKKWLTAAGFKDISVEPLVGPDSMVIAIK